VSVDVNDHYFPGCTVPCTRLCTCNESLSKLFRCSLYSQLSNVLLIASAHVPVMPLV
jgi:hypothetical protein